LPVSLRVIALSPNAAIQQVSHFGYDEQGIVPWQFSGITAMNVAARIGYQPLLRNSELLKPPLAHWFNFNLRLHLLWSLVHGFLLVRLFISRPTTPLPPQ
jgi:hypothetical protein